MATLNSFPNNADEYIGAEEVMRWLHGRTSGVYGADGNAAVSADGSGMSVTVTPGIGWITDVNVNGIVWWFNEIQELEIEAAEAFGLYNRIDRVVVQWRTTDYADKPELIVVKGTEPATAGAPATPPALVNTNEIRQISLAQVSISAGATVIDSEDITDERLDPTVCGIVTEAVTLDTTDVFNHYEEALAQLRAAIEEAWSGEISEGAVSMYYTGSIPTGWSGSDPYTKVVTVAGILATDHPIVDLLPSSTFSTAQEQIDAWGSIYKVVATADNTLTFYATDEPSVSIPIQVRCIRK